MCCEAREAKGLRGGPPARARAGRPAACCMHTSIVVLRAPSGQMRGRRQVLEIGFHAGGSARAMLSARGDVRVTSVDIARHGHEEAFAAHTRR